MAPLLGRLHWSGATAALALAADVWASGHCMAILLTVPALQLGALYGEVLTVALTAPRSGLVTLCCS